MTLRAPGAKMRPPVRCQHALGAGAVTASGGILYELIPLFGAARLRVRIKTATNGGTIDLIPVGPDCDPQQTPAFASLTGTLYTTGTPVQVAVTAGTEAMIQMDCWGEGYVIVKFTGTVGAGTITYCDVSQV